MTEVYQLVSKNYIYCKGDSMEGPPCFHIHQPKRIDDVLKKSVRFLYTFRTEDKVIHSPSS